MNLILNVCLKFLVYKNKPDSDLACMHNESEQKVIRNLFCTLYKSVQNQFFNEKFNFTTCDRRVFLYVYLKLFS